MQGSSDRQPKEAEAEASSSAASAFARWGLAAPAPLLQGGQCAARRGSSASVASWAATWAALYEVLTW